MPNIYIRDYEWAQSKIRNIDIETICDMLKIIEYQAKRCSVMENVGIEDKAAPEDALFVYILDALGVPPEGAIKRLQGEHESFLKDCHFTREWFEDLFYSEFLLENDKHRWTHYNIVELIKKEVRSGLLKHYK